MEFDPAYQYLMISTCYFPKTSQVVSFGVFLRGGFSNLEAQLEIVQAKFSQRINKAD